MKLVIVAATVALALAFQAGTPNEAKWGAALSGASPISDAEILDMYHDYLQDFEKEMTDLSLVMGAKFNNFKDTVHRVRSQNLKATWEAGLNQFSDMSEEEFFAYNHLGEEQICSATDRNAEDFQETKEAPESFDWTNVDGKNYVSAVKDQGRCGACWTFSSVGALEAIANINTDNTVDDAGRYHFSEQQLLECSRAEFDNYGCMGGLPSHAYEYMRYSGGLAVTEDYPYEATDEAESCKWEYNVDGSFKWDGAYVTSSGSSNITENMEGEAIQALAEVGPLAVSYEVVNDFRDYKAGVYQSDQCPDVGPLKVNHAVLAVGYGVENDVKFWRIKNSWGSRWGEDGYFKMERDVNLCSIGVCNSYPKDVTIVDNSQ